MVSIKSRFEQSEKLSQLFIWLLFVRHVWVIAFSAASISNLLKMLIFMSNDWQTDRAITLPLTEHAHTWDNHLKEVQTDNNFTLFYRGVSVSTRPSHPPSVGVWYRDYRGARVCINYIKVHTLQLACMIGQPSSDGWWKGCRVNFCNRPKDPECAYAYSVLEEQVNVYVCRFR